MQFRYINRTWVYIDLRWAQVYSDVCILVCGHLLRPLVSEAQQRRRSEDRLRFIWRQSHAGHPLGLFSCGQKPVVLHTLLLSSCRTQECVKQSTADLQTRTHTHARIHMHAHTHTHTHTRTHTYTRTLTHARTHTHTRTHTHANSHTRIHLPMHAHTHTHARTHTLTHARIHTHAYTLTHARTHAYTYTSTHTHVHTHARIQTPQSLSTARSHLLKVQFTLKFKYFHH